MFLKKEIFSKSGFEWYVNRPFCDNLQNIKYSLSVSEEEVSSSEYKKKPKNLFLIFFSFQ